MGCKIRDHQRFDNTRGVSEIIGAVLLVSLVVAAVSLVAVILFSQPTPKEVPNLNFMTGMNTSRNTLYLYHNGGDPLNAGEFSVLVDGVPKAYTISGGGSQWSLGKNLVVPISPAHVPDRVQIIYNGTSSGMGGGSVLSSGVVLREAASTNIVNSANISPDQQPYLDCSAVRNWDCADQIPLDIVTYEYLRRSSLKKMNFMQANQNRGAVVAGGHFNISVSKDNSSVILGDANCVTTTNFILKANDKLNITFDSAPDRFTAYGISPQIWMIVAGGTSRITTTITNVSGTYVFTNVLNARAVCSAWIQEYSEVDSTVTIQTINTGQMTSFVVNNTVYFNAPSGTSFTLTNIQPIGSGMFLVTYAGNTVPLYVIGWPDTVKFNGVTQTGLGL